MNNLFPFHLAATIAVCALAGGGTLSAEKAEPDRKPSLALKASPSVAFSPARVVLLAELRGGASDYEEYYCPSIEWDWGDGTTSENTEDCDPYQAGTTEIRRRWTVEHVYDLAGSYRVRFILKRHSKVVAATSVSLQIRPGLRESGEP